MTASSKKNPDGTWLSGTPLVGGVLVGIFILLTGLSFFWTPFDPTVHAMENRFQSPGWPYLLGTDHFGRDIFSMIMVGGRTSMAIAFGSVGIGVIIGVPLGLLAAARRGLADQFVMRANDVLFAFPSLLLALLLTAVSGPGAITAIVAIGVFNIPVFARLVRGSALSLWSRDFIDAAKLFGRSRTAISLDHILPTLAPIITAQMIIQMSVGITAEAGLSYIGLGVQPPTPSWGRMLNEAQTMTSISPWLAIFPGMAIVLTVLGLSLLSEGVGLRGSTRKQRILIKNREASK